MENGTVTRATYFHNKLGTSFRQRQLNLYTCDILIQNNLVKLHSSLTYLFLTMVLCKKKKKFMLIYNSWVFIISNYRIKQPTHCLARCRRTNEYGNLNSSLILPRTTCVISSTYNFCGYSQKLKIGITNSSCPQGHYEIKPLHKMLSSCYCVNYVSSLGQPEKRH